MAGTFGAMEAMVALADTYEELGRVLTDETGVPLCGADAAAALVAGGVVDAEQAATIAAVGDAAVAAAAAAIWKLRRIFDAHVETFSALEVVEARASLLHALERGDEALGFGAGHPLLDAHADAVRALAWYVTGDACELVEAAAAQMPNWTLSVEDLPAARGLVVFASAEVDPEADPVTGVPHWVNAISFGMFDDRGQQVVLFSEWSAYRDPQGWVRWMCASRFSWTVGTVLDSVGDQQVDAGLDPDTSAVDVVAGRRRMAALWALARSPRVLAQSEVAPTRPQRRRAQRDRINPTVALFDVRPLDPGSDPG